MTFYDEYLKYRDFNFEEAFKKVKDSDIERAINKDNLTLEDFLALISPKAQNYIEAMAQRSHKLTNQYFGKTILLYTPLYIANYCINKCAYCGFNIENHIKRNQLSLEEIEEEAKYISAKGYKHILLLTGDAPNYSTVQYIGEAVKILRKYFYSVGIEIYALTEEEYSYLIGLGVDSLTIYQEVYNEEIYDRVHLAGPKKDYRFRLEAPDRACKEGIRSVNIGALLGLDDWRKELFYTALHGKYIRDTYGNVEVGFSFPRIRPHAGVFEEVHEVNDKDLVQSITAVRMMFPNSGISISTRESEKFRDNLIPLGVTKMSAGSSTEVGGHVLKEKSEAQFDISDTRDEVEFKKVIKAKGYQPIFKDWVIL